MFANVVILRNTKQIDKYFTYEVPLKYVDRISKGARVIVPFGHEWVEGIVFDLIETMTQGMAYKIKPILFLFEDGIFMREEDLKMAHYLKDQYLCTWADACQLILPSGIMTTSATRYLYVKPSDEQILKKSELYLLELVKSKQTVTLEEVEELTRDIYALSTAKAALGRLTAYGLIEKEVFFESKVKDRFETWVSANEHSAQVLAGLSKRNTAQIKLLEFLLEVKEVSKKALFSAIKVGPTVLKSLIEAQAVSVWEREVLRLPEFVNTHESATKIVLNQEQNKVYNQIVTLYESGTDTTFLIHGVTGSGKTEVYAELIDYTLKKGKKAILMVPEIALTPQIVSRFVARFKTAKIAIIHSKISKGERHDQWKGIISGEYDIVIGARSAIFTPLDNIGLIVIDESHETSYRSEKNPKYQTQELAALKAQQHGAMVVMGTATPSVDEYYQAQQGLWHYLKLESRFNARPLPPVSIVDMREELMNGNKSMLSQLLYEKIKAALERKEQVIILLNRKGHSTFVSCRSCGYTLSCPNCDVTLTYFKGMHTVKCNYCTYEMYVPKKCPKCESHYFKYFGVGTEKVEEYLHELFPEAVIDRMDRTTTTKKGSVERIIQDVKNEKTDILIGTQMVAKGLDFKKVSLVGILSADLMLNLPQFQAAERAYQLFTQVSGRAGRADIEGEVVLQTYTPDHYALNSEGYDAFYEEEIAFRRTMHYPPFCRMVNYLFTSKDESTAQQYAIRSEQFIRKSLLKIHLQNEVEIYPANMALLKKIDNQYRYQILLKVPLKHIDAVRGISRKLDEKFIEVKECQISIDLNAINIL